MNHSTPLVSVICLCYNHDRFVQEAVESVINQSYRNIEIIVVDDASTDNSAAIIRQLVLKHPAIKGLLLEKNLGNCAAFNRGWALASGEYIIDFATDDVMMPNRIERQVNHFLTLDDSYGVVFTDAEYIEENGRFIRGHFDHLIKRKLIRHVPEGDIFRDVLASYFIAAPTMMIRSSVMKQLGGYDESLSYEDFDFWVRSSRICQYSFLNEVLTSIRKVKGSMSTGLYKRGDKQLLSTYHVCEKALHLLRSAEDREALERRVRYELRHSVLSSNHVEAGLFYGLLTKIARIRWSDKFLFGLSRFRIPLAQFRNLYLRIRFGETI